MEYKIYEWKIIELIDRYKEKTLILDPPYQRNFIWSKKDQDELIDSILIKKFPIPTFFLRQLPYGLFEMVDGQQRTRTILSFYKRRYENGVNNGSLNAEKDEFENYRLSITIIEKLEDNQSIEEFYARVNKTGRKLNKPELNKAEYFYTEFLALNSELAGSEEFKSLDLFSDSSAIRMNDIDFVSELVTQLVYGNFEKKDKVDDLYESDISIEQKNELKEKCLFIFQKINNLNNIFLIKKTRYRQRNDFFTLFGFINKYPDLNGETLKYFYKLLILIADEISPSNDFCAVLKDYAINCVSQSNQKRAREKRLAFFEELLLNTENNPNDTQKEIIEFYELPRVNSLKKIDNFWTLNIMELLKLKPLLDIHE